MLLYRVDIRFSSLQRINKKEIFALIERKRSVHRLDKHRNYFAVNFISLADMVL